MDKLPNDLDDLIRYLHDKPITELLKHTDLSRLSAADQEFLTKILLSIKDKWQGVILAFDPDTERMRFILVNTSQLGAVKLLSKAQQMVCENIEREDKK